MTYFSQSLKLNLQSKNKMFVYPLSHFLNSSFRPVKEYYLELEPLFNLDSLLLPNFLRNFHLDECQDLFEVVHPFFSISRIGFRMGEYHLMDVKQVCFCY